MTLTRQQLLIDLYVAFKCAKKHKANKKYVKDFEKNIKNNIESLCDDLLNRRYTALPSICFIVTEPKKREIFAANFRDRIVHHLYYNYTYQLFDRTFIEDSYSCRIGKGTHYGIARLEKNIKRASKNYTEDAYVLKMDIMGYFIHINREILYQTTMEYLNKVNYPQAEDLWACHKT